MFRKFEKGIVLFRHRYGEAYVAYTIPLGLYVKIASYILQSSAERFLPSFYKSACHKMVEVGDLSGSISSSRGDVTAMLDV